MNQYDYDNLVEEKKEIIAEIASLEKQNGNIEYINILYRKLELINIKINICIRDSEDVLRRLL